MESIKINNTEIIEQFLMIKINHTPTKKQYYEEIESFVKYIQNKLVFLVTKEEAQGYYEYLQTVKIYSAGKREYATEKNYSKSTIIKKLRILLTFYKYLQEIKCVPDNPFYYIKIPQQDIGIIKEEQILNPEEINKFLEAANKCSPRDKAIVQLMYYSKMSPQEICAFNWGDILPNLNGIVVKSRGQNERTVALKAENQDYLLNDYRLFINREPYKISPKEIDTPVFTNKNGNRISTTATLRNIVYKICKMAGIKKQVSPMDLGHTGTVEAIKKGATEEQIKNHGDFSSNEVVKKYKYSNLIHPACDLIPMEVTKTTNESED